MREGHNSQVLSASYVPPRSVTQPAHSTGSSVGAGYKFRHGALPQPNSLSALLGVWRLGQCWLTSGPRQSPPPLLQP